MTSFTPAMVIDYALTQALKALDRSDWDDLLGQLDVARSAVKNAIAYEQEHEHA
jgi:hypothetical protein